MSWGPIVGGLGGFVRLEGTAGGVERDDGVCMPLSLGEAEDDEDSLFVDEERSWAKCVSSLGVPWGTGDVDLDIGSFTTPGPGFGRMEVSSADIV